MDRPDDMSSSMLRWYFYRRADIRRYPWHTRPDGVTSESDLSQLRQIQNVYMNIRK